MLHTFCFAKYMKDGDSKMYQNKVSVDLWSKSYVFSETKNKETYTIDYLLLYHFFIKWKITLVIVTNL